MRKLVAIAFLLFCVLPSLTAQNLCEDPRAYATGSFELSSYDICHNENIRITGDEKVQDARYYFNYKGETYEMAYSQGETRLDFSEYMEKLKKPSVFTVIQVGKVDGKESVACKKIKVRYMDVPVYSYTYCPGPTIKLEITIPQHELNDFQDYSIKVNGQNYYTDALTYRDAFTVPNQPIKLHVTANGSPKTCPATSSEIEVPIFGGGRDWDYYPEITTLTLGDDLIPRMEITGQYDQTHTLYRYAAGANYNVAQAVKTGIKTGDLVSDIPPSLDKSYCYFIKADRVACVQMQFRSAEICTIPLKEGNSANIKENVLTWQRYSGPVDYRAFTPSGALSTSSWMEIARSEENLETKRLLDQDVQYVDKDVDCSKKYCYRIRLDHTGHISGANFQSRSYSNTVCLDHRLDLQDPPLGLLVSAEEQDNIISFNPPGDIQYKPVTWELYKKEGTTFTLSQTEEDVTKFTDEGVTKAETYKVRFFDACKNESPYSGEVTSVFLSEDGDNILDWTSGNPFDGSTISHYEVMYVNSGETFKESAQVNMHPVSTAEVVTEGTFIVRAVATDGRVSDSNPVRFFVRGALFLPNAFTPNSDGHNDTFGAKGSLTSIEKFQMDIFAPNGQKIAEVTDPMSGWDGKLPNGLLAPTGSYFYQIKAEMKSGQVLSKNGSFVVIH
ncbi:gliding motility-associated C-terminal domain-containing protein [Leadbetterella byssophila]|uniref:T9SS type B sorting domain-containing protein n=1 Tax=Leadbetterella byssophila TaxID=316068 RepID=UPI0039A21229